MRTIADYKRLRQIIKNLVDTVEIGMDADKKLVVDWGDSAVLGFIEQFIKDNFLTKEELEKYEEADEREELEEWDDFIERIAKIYEAEAVKLAEKKGWEVVNGMDGTTIVLPN